jgi:hypothetical protein
MADEKVKPREPVLPKLRPVSQERTRETAEEYTKHMREKVEQARQKQTESHDAETQQRNSTDEL